MEAWQIDHVIRNLPYLIKNTKCTVVLLAELQSRWVINGEERDLIKSKNTSIAESDELYRILITKPQAYDHLIQSLEITFQCGAVRILEQCSGEENWKKVGSIEFDTHVTLGTGNGHTSVYRGRMPFREPVAVKKIKCKTRSQEIIMNEIEILRMLPLHSNIVQFFHAEVCHGKFVLIALEMCTCTLEDCTTDKTYPLKKSAILQQVTTGLEFLHNNRIMHRDMKPANILIAYDENRFALVKLSDFGLSKVIEERRSSATATGPIGTKCWTSPEVLRYQDELAEGKPSKLSQSYATDIFPLGCIFFYVLTSGGHPFGTGTVCDANVLRGEYQLSLLEASKEKKAYLKIVKRMIADNPAERPSSTDVLKHIVGLNLNHLKISPIPAIITSIKEESESQRQDSLFEVFTNNQKAAREVTETTIAEANSLIQESPDNFTLRKFQSVSDNEATDGDKGKAETDNDPTGLEVSPSTACAQIVDHPRIYGEKTKESKLIRIKVLYGEGVARDHLLVAWGPYVRINVVPAVECDSGSVIASVRTTTKSWTVQMSWEQALMGFFGAKELSNPVWEEEFTFSVVPSKHKFFFQVFEEDRLKRGDYFAGSAELYFNSIPKKNNSGPVIPIEVKLSDRSQPTRLCGKLKVYAAYIEDEELMLD